MARENVSFTRYYYKVIIGGGGGGGGRIYVYTKKHGRTTRAAVGQDALPGRSNCSDTTKNHAQQLLDMED